MAITVGTDGPLTAVTLDRSQVRNAAGLPRAAARADAGGRSHPPGPARTGADVALRSGPVNRRDALAVTRSSRSRRPGCERAALRPGRPHR
ncbi:MAG TPA: hypothetical protein VGO94_10465, partial [Mycobacteriales bacterium]|nr:hypothetical protein [Mycobacteriales bacterium]